MNAVALQWIFPSDSGSGCEPLYEFGFSERSDRVFEAIGEKMLVVRGVIDEEMICECFFGVSWTVLATPLDFFSLGGSLGAWYKEFCHWEAVSVPDPL